MKVLRFGQSVLWVSFLLVASYAQEPKSFDDYLAQGNSYRSEGRYQLAINQFTAALRLRPRHTDTLVARADTYYKKGQLALALADCNTALQIEPRFGTAWKMRGTIYAKQNKFSDAAQEFQKAQEYHTEFDATDCFVVGNTYLQLQNYPAASEAFKNVVYLNRRTIIGVIRVDYVNSEQVYQALSHLGVISEKINELNAAHSYLSDAIALFPQKVDAYVLRADIFFRAKDYQRAADDYSKVVHLNPKQAQAWMNLGKCQHLIGYHDDAIQCNRTALKLNPKLIEAHFNVGLIYAYQGKWDNAKIAYETAIKSGTPNEIAAAISDVQAALQKQPGSWALTEALKLLQPSEKIAQ